MIHLSSYHSNGLPTVVWSNKVNLIGEKVYKPKIHFCENCNKPILIYGRLIPCKHVFCFTCATLCLPLSNANIIQEAISTPPISGPSEPPPPTNHSPLLPHHSPHNNNSNSSCSINNNSSTHQSDKYLQSRQSRGGNTNHNRNPDLNRNDSNHLSSHRDGNNGSLTNIDESTSNTTPNTIQLDAISSPNPNTGLNSNAQQQNQSSINKGCHRCGGRALRVERNTLNSIFVCQIETCKRTYLSARDLQAHVTHRHSKNKSNNYHGGTSSASIQAISSSPYISSSTLLHLNSNHNQHNSTTTATNSSNNHRQSSSTASTGINVNSNNHNHPMNNHKHRRESHHHGRDKERERERERDRHNKGRDGYQRDRERERDNKEYHRQSLQRAAQWAEANAQMLEKGLTR